MQHADNNRQKSTGSSNRMDVSVTINPTINSSLNGNIHAGMNFIDGLPLSFEPDRHTLVHRKRSDASETMKIEEKLSNPKKTDGNITY